MNEKCISATSLFYGLRRLGLERADQFARNPSAWMEWLINSLALPAWAHQGVSVGHLNPASSETVHAIAKMLGFSFAKVAHPIEKGAECFPIISGQHVSVVFWYMYEAN